MCRAGGTGIELAPCGCGALGARSRIVQDRPGTSDRSVVSFVVNPHPVPQYLRSETQYAEGRQCPRSSSAQVSRTGHLKAIGHSNFN
jgi:hypothetical protein